jgi:hypothetical protein
VSKAPESTEASGSGLDGKPSEVAEVGVPLTLQHQVFSVKQDIVLRYQVCSAKQDMALEHQVFSTKLNTALQHQVFTAKQRIRILKHNTINNRLQKEVQL